MQIASFLRRIILPYLACLAAPYFSTLSYKRHDVRKKIIEHTCGFIFSKTFVWNLYYSKKNSARYYQMDPLLSSDFNETWIFLTDFLEILKYQILWKSIQGELCCSMCVDSRRKDRQAVAFRNFSKAPKKNYASKPQNSCGRMKISPLSALVYMVNLS
jgi:hypothetical protein